MLDVWQMQVTRKLLDGEDMQELKIKFYKLMIEYHCLSEKDAFEIAQHYHQIYDTAIIKVVRHASSPCLFWGSVA
jgi:hypothetical protein